MFGRIQKFLPAAALFLIGTTPAFAITDGKLDGNAHPHVGLMVAQLADGTPLWRLISSCGVSSMYALPALMNTTAQSWSCWK